MTYKLYSRFLCWLFSEACTPNSLDRYNLSKAEFNESREQYHHDGLDSDELFSVELVDSIIQKLNLGRAAGLDKLTAEHLKYGHPCLTIILTKLINLLIGYKYVPKPFGKSITFSIPKSPCTKGVDNTYNYRGISMSPIFSNFF